VSIAGSGNDTTAPAQITGLVVVPVSGENSLSLSWNPSNSSDFSSYKIYRKDSSFNDTGLLN